MRAVRCPFCFICLDVSRIPVGRTIRCPACSGPIRVPQPERTSPVRFGLAGVVGGLIAGAAITWGVIRVFPLQMGSRTAGAQVSAPPITAGPDRTSGPRHEAKPIPDIDPDWQARADEIAHSLRQRYPKITLYASRPWLVALEHGPADPDWVAELYARALASLKEAFFREFGALDFPKLRRPLLVLVLRDRASYERYWAKHFGRLPPKGVPAIYLHAAQRSVTYFNESLTFGRLLHEGAHQLVAAVSLQPPRSFWLHEGLGCFFEPYEIQKSGSFVRVTCTTLRNMDRWYDFMSAMDDPSLQRYFSLRTMLEEMTLFSFERDSQRLASSPELREKIREIYYAGAWAVVYFLLRGPRKEYRDVLLEYFTLEGRSRSGGGSFLTLLQKRTGVSLEQFEKEFMAFIRAN